MLAQTAPIRWITPDDAKECAALDLYSDSFTTPWNETHFRDFLQDTLNAGFVLSRKGQIIGFVIYRINPHKRRVCIIRLCVARNYQRRKVGTHMVAEVLAKAKKMEGVTVAMAVNERNLPAQLFMKALGFTVKGIFHRAYQTEDDAYIFQHSEE